MLGSPLIGLLQGKNHEAGSIAHPKSELLRTREANDVTLSTKLKIWERGGLLLKSEGQWIWSSDIQVWEQWSILVSKTQNPLLFLSAGFWSPADAHSIYQLPCQSRLKRGTSRSRSCLNTGSLGLREVSPAIEVVIRASVHFPLHGRHQQILGFSLAMAV